MRDVSNRRLVKRTARLTLFCGVHLCLFWLGLADGLEKFGVQALSTGFLDGGENPGAQFGVVHLLGAGSRAFGHGEVGEWVWCKGRLLQQVASGWGKKSWRDGRGILGGGGSRPKAVIDWPACAPSPSDDFATSSSTCARRVSRRGYATATALDSRPEALKPLSTLPPL